VRKGETVNSGATVQNVQTTGCVKVNWKLLYITGYKDWQGVKYCRAEQGVFNEGGR
jgi:N-acetylmuramoyl-L-alanine amidase CwlA